MLVQQGYVKYALNKNGAAFDTIQTVTTAGMSPLPERTTSTTVVSADMNGNGTEDMVWIDAQGNVTYLDMFIVRPNLLTHIENGIGRTTDISYNSTVIQMALAREAGTPWKYRVPFPMTVVNKVDESDQLTNLHEVTTYRYNDGFYDGVEKQYRGHAHVETTMAGDMSQEDGLVVNDYDVGATDVYLHGTLLDESISSAGRLLSQTTHQYQKCPVELEVTAPQLSYPIWFACETMERTAYYEGTMTPKTTETDMTYDGFGNVLKTSHLGVVTGCDATCAGPSGSFGSPCGQMCLGDESYEEVQYVPRTMTNGAWIIHAPYREISYGVPGGDTSELLTYYDTVSGMPFTGMSGALTLGLPTRTTVAVNTNTAIPTSRVLYDANGEVISSMDPNGDPGDLTQHVRNYTYDADGVRPVTFDVLLKDHTLERKVRYDEHFNKPISSTSWMTVAGGKSTGENASAFEYDSFGRLTAIHDPDPATGQPATMPTKWFSYSLASPASSVGSFSTLNGESVRCVDGRGREYQERTRTAQGNYLVTGFRTFNTRGEPVQTYQPYSSGSNACDAAPPSGTLASSFRYDAAHRLILTTLPDDTIYKTASTERRVYLPLETQMFDRNDNDMASPFFNTPTIAHMDGLSRVVALGRTLMAGAPASFTVITYDGLGHASGYVDAAGNIKTQKYDLAGRLVETDDPNTGKTTFSYDAAGSLLSRTDARGSIIRFSYDGMNRALSRWDDADQSGTLASAIYDSDSACAQCSNTAGRFAGMNFPGGKDSVGYDVRGRVIYTARALEGFTFETDHSYDDRDRLVSTTYPDGRKLPRTYDDASRLTGIDGVLAGVAYDMRGQQTLAAYANGTSETQSYDALTRPQAQSLTTPAGPAQTLAFTRDRVGNVLAVDDTSPTPALAATYSYDAWYRTTEIALSDQKLDYQFDVLDNLTSAISSLGNKSAAHVGTYKYDPAHPNAVTQAGALALGYDAAGHLATRADRSFTWDAIGRMSSATLPDGTATYLFGPTQKRAIAIEPHAVTHYIEHDYEVQDGLGVLYVRIGQERVARLVSTALAAKLYTDVAPLGAPDGIITAGDAWVAQASSAGVLPSMSTSPVDRLLLSSARRMLYETVAQSTWFGHDELGSITVETDDKGAIIGRRSYYPFGAVRGSTGDADRYGFTNQEVDGTGLTHFDFRHLDSALGRWSAADPAFQFSSPTTLSAFGESTTGYAYVANNPANGVDPTGLKTFAEHWHSFKQSVKSFFSRSSSHEYYRVETRIPVRNGMTDDQATRAVTDTLGRHPAPGITHDRALETPQLGHVFGRQPITTTTALTTHADGTADQGSVLNEAEAGHRYQPHPGSSASLGFDIRTVNHEVFLGTTGTGDPAEHALERKFIGGAIVDRWAVAHARDAVGDLDMREELVDFADMNNQGIL